MHDPPGESCQILGMRIMEHLVERLDNVQNHRNHAGDSLLELGKGWPMMFEPNMWVQYVGRRATDLAPLPLAHNNPACTRREHLRLHRPRSNGSMIDDRCTRALDARRRRFHLPTSIAAIVAVIHLAPPLGPGTALGISNRPAQIPQSAGPEINHPDRALGPRLIGSIYCYACHQELALEFARTKMGKLFSTEAQEST
jgi:hypothetical protein